MDLPDDGRDRPDPFDRSTADGAALQDVLGTHAVAVVLGSGWAGVAERLGRVVGRRSFAELGLAAPGVAGHGATVSSVEVTGSGPDPTRVLVLAGRVHLYEGHPVETVVRPVRAAVLAGAGTVVLTNAAGSLRSDRPVGSVVAVRDQLNLTGENPMCGPHPPAALPGRFVDLSDLYSARLRDRLLEVRPELSEGVYAGVRGGSFETPAEIRMLRTLGADLVGMSTVLESIAAHHLGAEVVGLSLVTNLAAGMQAGVDHLEVLDVAATALPELVEVLRDVIDAAAPGS